MFEDLKEWKRGSGELGVLDTFYELAKKARKEAGAEVMVVIQFPGWSEPHVIALTPELPLPRRGSSWTSPAVAAGMRRFKMWLDRRDESTIEIQKEFTRLKSQPWDK